MRPDNKSFLPLLALSLLGGLYAVGCQSSDDVGPEGTTTERSQRIDEGSRAEANRSPSDQMHMLMMEPMEDMTTTGIVDKDFASMMSQHHMQAIRMARIEVENGKNEDLKQLAQKMLDAQTKESDQLATLKDQVSDGPKNEEASNRLHEIMMRPMKNMVMSGDVDKDFAMMMAEHHQSAIDMAQVEVEHGTHPEIKQLAQKIMRDQKLEREKLMQHASG